MYRLDTEGIIMKTKAIFYHAGCSVCIAAESALAGSLDPQRFDVEIVDFTHSPQRITEAEGFGVVCVPAFVIDAVPYHINFGASMADVKG
jgi:hypothetical protein